jgi:hypothetical protein
MGAISSLQPRPQSIISRTVIRFFDKSMDMAVAGSSASETELVSACYRKSVATPPADAGIMPR